ncbi:hemin uptake protein HemP [Roseovarius aestuarii]|uniref:Hemin uptake protein hemP n=1 Tax=Roseovarius aestuarii TaxID=475083 RepID=A0A1X7BUH9_9RHOB|nr:hemin uptake protein HemP [Roseovarius aestuarii]SMC13341.1 Hemin uptake protein hemP [Roseovarius aestuarii]
MSVTFPTTLKGVDAAPRQVDVSTDTTTPAYFASDLTKNGQLAHICHHDQIYTLRITRAGKLILTK